MSKIGVMMSSNQLDSTLSEHFGKAPWILFTDGEDTGSEFVENEGMNGRSAAQIVHEHGCSDVILVDIGDGALGHLQSAGIRAWAAPGPVSAREALRLFAEGKLTSLPAEQIAAGHHEHHGHHGCCCGHHAGHRDASGAASCCKG